MTMISKNYDVRELVPPEIYNRFGPDSVRYVSQDVVDFLEWISDYLKVHVIVNNWHFFQANPKPTGKEEWFLDGHIYKNSGFRMPDCPEGANLSQHKFKDAIDCKASGFETGTIRGIVIENFESLKERFGVSTIEIDTPTWDHVSFCLTGLDHLLLLPYK